MPCRPASSQRISGPRPTRASRCSRGSRARPDGTDYIYNDHYQQIAEVSAGNGYLTDFHEFLITPWNTALILADASGTANLTSIGGPADQKVFNGIVQEIDIPTGKVLFRGTVPTTFYRDSHPSGLLRRRSPGTGSPSTPSISTPTGTC